MTRSAPSWLENERAIFALAQSEVRWIAAATHADFWHPEDGEYLTAWPVRLLWTLWWMPEPRPQPRTPGDLAEVLERFPPRDPDWATGYLIDPGATAALTVDEPRVIPSGPILPAGTRVRSGRSRPDFCDGFDSQAAAVVSGPWTGTHVNLQIGRAGEPFLIARLALMSEGEPLVSDAAAAETLLSRLRDVETKRPS